jgi:alkylation response protein AidB-like acyl-CoA dehydrogenase
MDIELTEEQRKIQQTVREFAEAEVRPYVRDYDREERFPIEIAKKMAKLGWLGGVIPEQYGGAGLDYMTYTVMLEEMAKVCQVASATMSYASGLHGSALLLYGTEAQRQKYLVPLARGEVFGATGVTEPHSGTDVAAMETTAVDRGDHYLVNGTKVWISMGDHAGWFLSFATLDKAVKYKPTIAFVVDQGTPGLSWRPFKNKLGFRALGTGELVFQDMRVRKDQLLGGVGDGFRVAMCSVENGRLGVAARAVGMAQACLDLAVRYAQSRIVFDQPIGRFQLVQSMVTDMVVGVESARYFTYRLARLKDQGRRRARLESSLAKMHATDVCMLAAQHCMQIHGAYGCHEEYEIGRIWRDAKFMQVIEGQNQIHRAMIAEFALGYRQE